MLGTRQSENVRLAISGGRTKMDKITESLLNEFSEEHGLLSLSESKRFEHFACYSVFKREHTETFDTTDLVVGDGKGYAKTSKDGSDIGLDAVAILVNGTLITDIDDFKEINSSASYLDITFLLLQAETSSNFDSAKIGTFGFGCRDLFSEQPQLKRNNKLSAVAEIVQEILAHGSKFKKGNPMCKLYYVTTGKWTGEQAPEARITTAKSDLMATGLFRDVSFDPIGGQRIQELYRKTKNAVSSEFNFATQVLVKPDIANIEEAYFGFLPWSEFRKIIEDDSGNLMTRLFFDNVRDWQGEDNKVNAEIKATLKSTQKDLFVLMNNGVTVIARELRRVRDQFTIEDYQIVNGCQTSNVLHGQRVDLDDNVVIPIRLIATKNEEVTLSIIKATNRQTTVDEEQFFASQDFPKTLELYFASYPLQQRLYFERRDGQYTSLAIEKTRIITFPNMIRAFAAMFLNEPHRTTRNFSGLKAKMGTGIFAKNHRMEPYYVSALALYRLEFLFRNGKLDSKYKPARYHIILALRLLIAGYEMPIVTANAMENYCQKITDVLHDTLKSEEIILTAAEAVDDCAGGVIDRDSIRTEPFTEKVIDALTG